MEHYFNLFTVLKKLKECVGFFFFNNLIATNGLQPYFSAGKIALNNIKSTNL